jgi:hypothetical protein
MLPIHIKEEMMAKIRQRGPEAFIWQCKETDEDGNVCNMSGMSGSREGARRAARNHIDGTHKS